MAGGRCLLWPRGNRRYSRKSGSPFLFSLRRLLAECCSFVPKDWLRLRLLRARLGPCRMPMNGLCRQGCVGPERSRRPGSRGVAQCGAAGLEKPLTGLEVNNLHKALYYLQSWLKQKQKTKESSKGAVRPSISTMALVSIFPPEVFLPLRRVTVTQAVI